MIKVKVFDNNLKLIVKTVNTTKAVGMGIFVGVGSNKEDSSNNGISHFIEHTTFKGTLKRNAFQISDDFDMLGSQVNAFTSKNMTCYHAKCIHEKQEQTFEILSDIFVNSIYAQEELDKEKGVIVEEINMSEDTPDEVCLDLLDNSFFGDNGYGRTILGSKENVNSFTKNDVLSFLDKHYLASNIVISFAGNITFEVAQNLVLKYLYDKIRVGEYSCNQNINLVNLQNHKAVNKQIEQVHIGLAMQGVNYLDENKDLLQLGNIAIGGGMSSRLFQEVREKQGLAYSVYSFTTSYLNTGCYSVYAGVNKENSNKAFESIIKVIKDVKEKGLKQNEFDRCLAQMVSSFIYAQESVLSEMLLYGRYLLSTGKVFDYDEKLNVINNIKIEQVNEYLKTLKIDELSTAIVGENVKPLM